jgi:hypothetical protein
MVIAIALFSESTIDNRQSSHIGLGFAQAGDAVARLPLAAPLQYFHALETFEYVAFCAGRAGGAQAAM